MFGFGKKKQLKEEVESLREELEQIKNEAKGDYPLSWSDVFGGNVTASGAVVNTTTAMRVSAVFACVNLISGAVSSSPARIFKRDGELNLPAPKHGLSRLLSLRPNEYMTASTFWQMFASQKVLNGNGYAGIIRTRNGKAEALVPLLEHRVEPYQAWQLGLDQKLNVSASRLYYQVMWDDGTSSVLDQDDMLHVPNIGWNGWKGLSTIKAGAESMGLALSAEKSASALFSNGMRPDLAISYPKNLSDDAFARLREHLDQRYSGAGNHHKPMILEADGSAKTLSMNADDAQLIESRAFSVVDIARFFSVPPVMIGQSDKTSSWGSGVEQMARWFTTFTMNNHFTSIEQELEIKIFRTGTYFAKFDESELTRGDTKTRHDSYKTARGSMQEPGYMTINEIREREGLPPIEGGDALQKPMIKEAAKNEQ